MYKTKLLFPLIFGLMIYSCMFPTDPTGINFPIPGNDDARRAINLYCDLIKHTILDAQQNISRTDSEDVKIKIKKDEPKIEAKNEKSKKIKPEKREKIRIEIKGFNHGSKAKKTQNGFQKVS